MMITPVDPPITYVPYVVRRTDNDQWLSFQMTPVQPRAGVCIIFHLTDGEWIDADELKNAVAGCVHHASDGRRYRVPAAIKQRMIRVSPDTGSLDVFTLRPGDVFSSFGGTDAPPGRWVQVGIIERDGCKITDAFGRWVCINSLEEQTEGE